MATHQHYRCRFCGPVLPDWRPVLQMRHNTPVRDLYGCFPPTAQKSYIERYEVVQEESCNRTSYSTGAHMANWRGFEQLAARIYRELSPEARVVHNDHIAGQDSGVPRQIDVSIRYAIAGHDLLIIVQAKDYSEPADINIVGEFATVISDVRANKGVLICRGSFTSGAQALANNRGIDLCNLYDAESRDWRVDISLPILWIDLLPIAQFGIQAHFDAGDSIPRAPQDWVLSADRGKTRLLPLKIFVDAWNAGRLPRAVGPRHHVVPAGLPKVEILTQAADGNHCWRNVHAIPFTYTVSKRAWLGSFTPEQCRGILNYKDGRFEPSYLPIGAIPVERDSSWKKVENPEQLAISILGYLVTTEGWQIDVSTPLTEVTVTRIEEEVC